MNPDRRTVRAGMTLIEMLVALAATLVLMAAVAQAFNAFGNAITGSRAILELDARLRSTAWRLRSDLAGATARPLPPLPADSGEGYFEIIEGPATERIESVAANTTVAAADADDVLLFTARNTDTPFIGRAPTSTASGSASWLQDSFESTLAEIGWFTRQTLPPTNPVTYTLYRKQFLVMGYVGTDPFSAGFGSDNAISLPKTSSGRTIANFSDFLNLPCDVSVRSERNTLVPNALADLARREFRFMHNVLGTTNAATFPYPFVAHQTPSTDSTKEVLPAAIDGLIFDSTSQRFGEDVILTNVLAFDVRVFDPAAPVAVSADGETAIVPGDVTPFSGGAVASGCYVDLGNGVTSNALLGADVNPRFAGFGQAKSKLNGGTNFPRTFDTWSTHYEANGIDEDNVSGVDQGTNGLDDDNDGQPDERPYSAAGQATFTDAEETETLPPYPYPLRGIEVRIRCYEPSSRQVRQVTIRHTFVPH